MTSDIKNAFYNFQNAGDSPWYGNPDAPSFYSLTFDRTKSHADWFSRDHGYAADFSSTCAYLNPAAWDKNAPEGTGMDNAISKLPGCEFWLKKMTEKYPDDLDAKNDLTLVQETMVKTDEAKLKMKQALDASLSDAVLNAILARPGMNDSAKAAVQAGFTKARTELAQSIQLTPMELLASGLPITGSDGKVEGKDLGQWLLSVYFDVSGVTNYPVPNVTQ